MLSKAKLLVSQAVVERIPNAVTMRNQIPKAYLPFDLYCNLIPNNDPNNATFMQVPRTGSFEVSYKGLVSLTLCLCDTVPALHSLFIYYS